MVNASACPATLAPVTLSEYLQPTVDANFQGEYVAKIALDYGFTDFMQVWTYGPNAELRSERKSPNVLLPGDTIEIPEKNTAPTSGATGQRHRFKAKGKPPRLRIVLLNADETPISGTDLMYVANYCFTARTSTERFSIQISLSAVIPIRIFPCSLRTAVLAAGRLTSTPDSFMKEAVTTKKISMMKTMSNIGVMLNSVC